MEPRCQVARIVYFTDMTVPDALVIPLGAFAECLTEKVHGLAMTARPSLTEDELAKISPLMRDALRNPYAFFRDRFDEVWKETKGTGESLDRLTRAHIGALSVLAPTDAKEKVWFIEREIHPRNEAVTEKLLAAVKRELSLMHEVGDEVGGQAMEIPVKKLAA